MSYYIFRCDEQHSHDGLAIISADHPLTARETLENAEKHRFYRGQGVLHIVDEEGCALFDPDKEIKWRLVMDIVGPHRGEPSILAAAYHKEEKNWFTRLMIALMAARHAYAAEIHSKL